MVMKMEMKYIGLILLISFIFPTSATIQDCKCDGIILTQEKIELIKTMILLISTLLCAIALILIAWIVLSFYRGLR